MIWLKVLYSAVSLFIALTLVCMLFSHMLDSSKVFRGAIAVLAGGCAVGCLSVAFPSFHPPLWLVLETIGLAVVVAMMHWRHIEGGTAGQSLCEIPPAWKDWFIRLFDRRDAAIKRLLVVALIGGFCLFAAPPSFADEEEVQPQGRSAECSKLLEDQIYIAQMFLHGIDSQRMRQKAMNSRAHLGEEHFQKIMGLIDDAENAVHEDALQAWLNGYWKKCMEVI